jgi:hypothetical protein
MVSELVATPRRGRELVRGNCPAAKKPTSRSVTGRIFYDTEARGSQREMM